jgi:signal transduction histidine kinase
MIKTRVDEKRLVAMVDRSLGSVSQGEKLVRHLMSFARQQPIKREVIDLRSMLPDVVEMVARALPRIAVESQIAADLWPVFTDRNFLESAILNLAFNARDAMSNDGTLTVAAQNVQPNPTTSRRRRILSPSPLRILAQGWLPRFWSAYSSLFSQRRKMVRVRASV